MRRRRPSHDACCDAARSRATQPASSQAGDWYDRAPAIDRYYGSSAINGGMSGHQLVDAVVARRPGMKVLYTSGYSDDAIVHEGHLDPGVALLKSHTGRQIGAEDPRGARRLVAPTRKRGGMAPAALQLLCSLVQG